jgi:hypothetical protein
VVAGGGGEERAAARRRVELELAAAEAPKPGQRRMAGEATVEAHRQRVPAQLLHYGFLLGNLLVRAVAGGAAI